MLHRSNSPLLLAALLSLYASSAPAQSEPAKLKSIEQLISEAHAGVKFIDAAELKTRIAANPKLVLLDVRTAKEFEAAHLKGAAWVERGTAEFVMVRQLPEPEAEIVVYCKVGNRTGLTVKALQQTGYRNVVGLAGGFDEWVEQGNSVHNYLGEFRMVNPTSRNAASTRVDFYQDKR